MKMFLIDETLVSLEDALVANSEDAEVCEFLRNADVGDVYIGQFASEIAKRVA